MIIPAGSKRPRPNANPDPSALAYSSPKNGLDDGVHRSHRFTERVTKLSNAAFGRTKLVSFPCFIQPGVRLRL